MITRGLFVCMGALLLIYAPICGQNPQWLWALDGGSGSSEDDAYDMTRDANGYLYITGEIGSPAYFGDSVLTGQGFCSTELVVAKILPEGTWAWALRAGGSGYDMGHGIAAGLDGSLYVTGKNGATADFGIHTLTGSGAFVAKIGIGGVWESALRFNGDARDIAVDADGNRYVTGHFTGSATFGATTLASAGDYDIFVAKQSPAGAWLWAKRAGAPATEYLDDQGYGIALDADANVYIIGNFCGTADFGSTSLTAGNTDIFIAKLNTSGDWIWAKKAGGSSADAGYDIATDTYGNCYVTGKCKTGYFGSINLSTSGFDAFVTKLDPDGNFLWVRKGGGNFEDAAQGIAVDAMGNCYFTGYYTRNATFGSTLLENINSSNDIFVAKLDTSGNWDWAVRAASANGEMADAIDVDSAGTCYITGTYYGSISFGTHTLSSTGGENSEIFVAALGVAPPLEPTGLQITKAGNDIQLQWEEVTQNTQGGEIEPSHYSIYFSSEPGPDATYTFLDDATGTSYTHTGGALGAEKRFYHVKAILQD